MKITKSQLKQIIKEELEDVLGPDVDEDESEPPHVPSISLEGGADEGRTVMDDVEPYVDELACDGYYR